MFTNQNLIFFLIWPVFKSAQNNLVSVLVNVLVRKISIILAGTVRDSLPWSEHRSTLAKGVCLKVRVLRDEASIDIYGKILEFLESWGSNQP